jgi:hypothetical protein
VGKSGFVEVLLLVGVAKVAVGVGDRDWQVGVGGDWCDGVDEAGEADEVVWFDEPVEVGSVGVGFVVVAGPDQAGSARRGRAEFPRRSSERCQRGCGRTV